MDLWLFSFGTDPFFSGRPEGEGSKHHNQQNLLCVSYELVVRPALSLIIDPFFERVFTTIMYIFLCILCDNFRDQFYIKDVRFRTWSFLH